MGASLLQPTAAGPACLVGAVQRVRGGARAAEGGVGVDGGVGQVLTRRAVGDGRRGFQARVVGHARDGPLVIRNRRETGVARLRGTEELVGGPLSQAAQPSAARPAPRAGTSAAWQCMATARGVAGPDRPLIALLSAPCRHRGLGAWRRPRPGTRCSWARRGTFRTQARCTRPRGCTGHRRAGSPRRKSRTGQSRRCRTPSTAPRN